MKINVTPPHPGTYINRDVTSYALVPDCIVTVSLLLAYLLLFNVQTGYGQSWNTNGNSVSSADVLGATNASSLKIISDNQIRMTILPGGNVGIGTQLPIKALHIFTQHSLGLPSSHMGIRLEDESNILGLGIRYSVWDKANAPLQCWPEYAYPDTGNQYS